MDWCVRDVWYSLDDVKVGERYLSGLAWDGGEALMEGWDLVFMLFGEQSLRQTELGGIQKSFTQIDLKQSVPTEYSASIIKSIKT